MGGDDLGGCGHLDDDERSKDLKKDETQTAGQKRGVATQGGLAGDQDYTADEDPVDTAAGGGSKPVNVLEHAKPMHAEVGS